MIIWIDQLFQTSLQGKVESTASLGFDNLMAIVAERSGYGYRADQAAGLSDAEELEVGLYVEEGQRDFLLSYDWSFMRPVATSVLWATTTATTTMTTGGESDKTITASVATFYPTMVGHTIVSTNGSYVIDGYSSSTVVTVTSDASADSGEAFQITADGSYRLPDDFGGLIGDVYFQANDGLWLSLSSTGVAELLELLQVSTSTGRPTVCTVEAINVSGLIGQRFDLLTWRIADSNYTVRYQYQVLPDQLVANGYPYGGARHAETIKYACLAAMERSKQQLADGPYQRQYNRFLALSIRADQRGRAGSLGLLVDARPGRWRRGNYGPLARTVTVGGVSYP
ncbi:hypothetical protein LCGC14_0589750 [marine sediment metagenome]|uniref:Uncharacterized protein n=1 Tax=marine sediment metagenome TaxID=412755 RepID=A0A0F9U019_9ZZZZ